MEEPSRRRDRGDLVAYALVVVLVVALVIGVLHLLGGQPPGSIFSNIKQDL